MHAGMAATYLLPHVVGEAHARDLLLTGRTVDADEALRLGLVSRVLPPESFLDDVLEVAAGIAATAPIASRLTTVALRDGGHADFETAVQWEALAQPLTLATADLQEGIAAAREKRPGPVHRPLTGQVPGRTERGPLPHRCAACLPLANAAPTRPRASSAPQPRCGLRAPVNDPRSCPPLWITLWTKCGRACTPCGPGCGKPWTDLWGTRPGRSPVAR